MSQVTDEMVVKVARALAASHNVEFAWEEWVEDAKVAIAVIRESVVRECIAAFDGIVGQVPISAVRERLQSLLPTDRAEELVARYIASDSSDHVPGTLIDPVKFARWLIERENANG